MTGDSRFGKCDECGAMGILNSVALSECGPATNFCPTCHRIFQDRPELSSFIAFERGKPRREHVRPSEAGLALGHGEKVSVPEARKQLVFAIGKADEARNSKGNPPNFPR